MNMTKEQMEAKLHELAGLMGMSVTEYVTGLGYATVGDVELAVKELDDRIHAITELEDNGEISLAEKVAQINAVLSTDGTIENILSLVNGNKSAIQSLNTVVAENYGIYKEWNLKQDSLIANNKLSLDNHKVWTETQMGVLHKYVDTNQASINVLDIKVTDMSGTLGEKLDAEISRAKYSEVKVLSDAIAESNQYSDEQDVITRDMIKSLENSVGDIVNPDTGEVDKGLETRMSDAETAIVKLFADTDVALTVSQKETRDYIDANFLGSAEIEAIDVNAVNATFRSALGLSPFHLESAVI
ncbi:MAG: hypothetical protein GQ570_11240 [Helicobacteraceae bacterium]|nr:hypothetical protein [Helicobacteraceae bacterium]